MASNTAGAGAGLITITARPAPTSAPSIKITTDAELRHRAAAAAPAAVTADRWRGHARALDREADHAYTLAERQRLRRLADGCRVRAARMSPSGKVAVRKAVAA